MWNGIVTLSAAALRDLRIGARQILRHPLTFFVSALSLALGIGVNISLFQLFDGLVARPVPVRDSARVVRVYRGGANGYGTGFAYPEYITFAENCRSLNGLAAASPVLVRFGRDEDGAESGPGLLLSANYFVTLGSPVELGRGFQSRVDDMPDSAPVTMLGFEYWRSHFGSDPNALGRIVKLNGTAFTVIGVAGRQFASFTGLTPRVMVPLEQERVLNHGSVRLTEEMQQWLAVAGRLRDGVEKAQAEAELSALDAHWREGRTRRDDASRIVLSRNLRFTPSELRKVEVAFALMWIFTWLVFLISAANTANLIAARIVGRRVEFGIRVALGAARSHLVRQMLAEDVLLSVMSGAMALAISRWLELSINAWIALPVSLGIRWDYRVLAVTAAASAVACLAICFVPVRHATGAEPLAVMRGVGASEQGGTARTRARNKLVMVQVACCFVLMVAAVLLARGIERAGRLDPGFDPRGTLSLTLPLASNGYDAERSEALLNALIERIRGLASVSSVAVADSYPFGSFRTTTLVKGMNVLASRVSPNYFDTLGIPIHRGRAFTAGEKGAAVVIVSQSLARRLWPAEEALGKTIEVGRATRQVIGIVGDLEMQQQDNTTGQLYELVRGEDMIRASLLVKTGGTNPGLPKAILQTVAEHDGTITANCGALQDRLAEYLEPFRIAALAAGGLGLLACLLALTGVYGLAAYTAGWQVKECGVRIALGSSRSEILVLMVRRCMTPVASGIGIGLLAAPLVLGWMRSLLFGLSPTDPITFVLSAGVLSGAALLAVFAPAWKVSRMDPAACLRHE